MATAFGPLVRAEELTGFTTPVSLVWVTLRADDALPAALAAGTRHMALDAIHDGTAQWLHHAPDADPLHKALAALALPSDAPVLLIADGYTIAARAWWLFQLAGWRNVSVLENMIADYPLPLTAPVDVQPPRQPHHPRSISTLNEVRAACQLPGVRILDARPSGRFAGRDAEPTPHVRRGHIPGSLNLPVSQLLDAEQRLLPVETLRVLFAQKRLKKRERIITTCGSGMSASLLAFALTAAGFDNVAVYDGSWQEWNQHPETPVALGEGGII